jgi:hypothetical protein
LEEGLLFKFFSVLAFLTNLFDGLQGAEAELPGKK